MRIKEISYSRTFSMDGYENKKVGVIVEVQNDDAEDALRQAAEFVERQHPEQEIREREAAENAKYKECEKIVANPKDHSIEKIAEAAKYLKESNDYPF